MIKSVYPCPRLHPRSRGTFRSEQQPTIVFSTQQVSLVSPGGFFRLSMIFQLGGGALKFALFVLPLQVLSAELPIWLGDFAVKPMQPASLAGKGILFRPFCPNRAPRENSSHKEPHGIPNISPGRLASGLTTGTFCIAKIVTYTRYKDMLKIPTTSLTRV